MSSVIDQFMIALGFRVDDKGLVNMREKAEEARESVLGIGRAIAAAVGGLSAGFAVKKIAEIGSTFEQNQIQIAGFLSALGQSKDFNTGLQDAAGVIKQITIDAAKLPGEAEEYIEVFKAGLPVVQSAMPGGSLDDFTAFTNRLTAIGKTFSIDAGTISRELTEILSPGRGAASKRFPLFRQLLPFMQQLRGEAHLTAESFNAMTAPQRLALLQGAFAKLQPMVDASASSFDALWGAVVSGAGQLIRLATGPLFEAMKGALDQVNALFFDSKGNLTALGQGFVDAIKMASRFGANMVRHVTTVIGHLARMPAAVRVIKAVLAALAAAVALMFGPVALILDDLLTYLEGGDSVLGLLLARFPRIQAAAEAFWAVLTFLVDVIGTLMDIVSAASPTIEDALKFAFSPITNAIDGLEELLSLAARLPLIGKAAKLLGFEPEAADAPDMGGAGVLARAVPDMGGGGVLAPARRRSHRAKPTAPLFTPPSFDFVPPPPRGLGAGSSTVTNITGNTINVSSPDPTRAGEAVRRELDARARSLTRTGQSGTAY